MSNEEFSNSMTDEKESALEEFSYAKWKARTGMSWDRYIKLRAQVWAEQGFKCAQCGTEIGIPFTPGSLELHHKDHNPKNNKRFNLEVVCGACHKKTHGTRQFEMKTTNPIEQKLLKHGHSNPKSGACKVEQNQDEDLRLHDFNRRKNEVGRGLREIAELFGMKLIRMQSRRGDQKTFFTMRGDISDGEAKRRLEDDLRGLAIDNEGDLNARFKDYVAEGNIEIF